MGEEKRAQQRKNKHREKESEKITKRRLCHNCNNFTREDLQDIGKHITHAIYSGAIISQEVQNEKFAQLEKHRGTHK